MDRMRQATDALNLVGRHRLAAILFLGIALALAGVGMAVFWVVQGGGSPQDFEQRLRAEVPVGSGQDALLAWLDRNGLVTRAWQYPANTASLVPTPPGVASGSWGGVRGFPGLSVPPGGAVVWVAALAHSGRDKNLRPLRSDLYVFLDRDARVSSYFVHTYPRKGEWERLP